MSVVQFQAARKPSIYLAGAIRDGVKDDIDWRERAISELAGLAVFLNPLGGKTYDPATRAWSVNGIKPTTDVIVPHDFWCVDHADILIVNLTSLASGYPSIGTLMEFGRATARGSLVYAIVEQGYAGHDSPTLFKLHPFLERNSAVVFPGVDPCIDFLRGHLGVLSGATPNFHGYAA
jgi:nucleoside 2-deoxyribosyltransferase